MSKSHVVVDGSNIATEGRSLPSLKQLDEAVRAFLAEHPHDVCTVVVDATFEHRIDASEKKMYDDALAANELLTPPAGSIGRGDKFILEIADRVGASVFSNDSFQEFHGEYEWLFDEGRLIGGKPVPGVGWVFVARTPVRGPKSRQATRAAGRKRERAATGSASKKAKHSAGPVAKPPTPSKQTPPPPPRPAKKRAPAERAPSEPVNAALPFIEFVAEHQLGAEVEAEVVEFSSHGAYVTVGDVRCYAPLKLLGDPAPRSAREVLTRGERRTFVVHAIHAARRGIDVGLPAVAGTAVAAAHQTVTEHIGTDQAPAEAGASLPESEATLAPAKKAPAKRKAAAKKAPAKKSTAARKATAAKKSTAKKSTAKKSTARKSTAKKSTAKKSTAKKSTAKKSTAKKSTARKSTAKKSTAKKSTAKKSTAKKSTAKKSTAKKKAGAKRAPARKKAAAKKAPAKKRSTAKKAGTRKKSAARKAPARKR